MCEVCGGAIEQLLYHTCDERFGQSYGPWFERREHVLDYGRMTHRWVQVHNCVKPEADRCWHYPCNEDPERTEFKFTPPACCRAAAGG
jgi:hypothetical protein